MTKNWTDQDAEAARAMGWDLYEIWDTGRCRLEYEVQRYGGLFSNDEAARAFVRINANAGKELAAKALVLAFRSKTGSTPHK